MAAKKTTKKTTKKAKTPKRAAATGGEAPTAVQTVSTPPLPPPPVVDEEVASRRAALDAIASQYNEEGHMAVIRADEAANPYIKRRPTGIMEMDIDLGGGFPAGGACFVSGPDNAGKTWLVLNTMAYQQRIYGEACTLGYAHNEGAFPYDQAVRVGLKVGIPDEIIRAWQQVQVQRGLPGYTLEKINMMREKVGDFRLIRGSTGEEVLGIILKFVATNACSVVGLDSIQGLTPSVDVAKELEENNKMAAHAFLMQRFFDKYVPLTTGLSGTNETTLLFTQQVRSNPQKASAPSHIAKYLPDWAIAGGWAAKHYKLIDLVLSHGSLTKRDMTGGGKEVTKKVLKWETLKGKAGTHDHLTGEVQYSYALPQGVDYQQTVIDAGILRGVIRKPNKHKGEIIVVRPEDNVILDAYTAPTMKAFKQFMYDDFDFELALRLEVLAAAGKKECIYR